MSRPSLILPKRSNPDFADAYFNRGGIYGLKGLHDQAIADLTKAIDLKPGFVEAHLLRGIEYDNKKLYDQALADLTKVID
jgi:tetratricopeptide (TPR) repeat protein